MTMSAVECRTSATREARALLRRPALLVLDEPTANVDEPSERDVVEALRGLKERATVVLVSHKASILADAHRTLDFDGATPRATEGEPASCAAIAG